MFVTDGDGGVVAKLLHDPYKKRDSAEVIIDAALGRFKLQKARRLYRWLLTMEEWSAPPLMAVLEACHSGNFLQKSKGLVADGRTVIASASADKQSKIARSSSFSRTFFSLIESNQPIAEAFEQASQRLERMPYHLGNRISSTVTVMIVRLR